QGRAKESIPWFEKGAALARANMDDASLVRSLYNLACAYAESSRFDEALTTLSECLRKRPDLKGQARNDSSFAKALERKDFQDLLKYLATSSVVLATRAAHDEPDRRVSRRYVRSRDRRDSRPGQK